MLSRTLLAVLLASLCVGAAAGGAFLAVRQHSEPVAAQGPPAAPQEAPLLAVHETEALVAPSEGGPDAEAPQLEAPAAPRAAAPRPRRPVETRVASNPAPRRAAEPAPRRAAEPASSRAAVPAPHHPAEPPASLESLPAREAATAALPLPALAPGPDVLPHAVEAPVVATRAEPLPPMRLFEDLTIPAATVVGLHIETPVSSERARLEDRVEARVVRDVVVDGRTAIPAGSRAIGAVTLVERGGKMQDRARLGVRFHTLVLADGTHVGMRTDPIFREGDSPSAESARKIGGAAAGGAILGAIIGGKKGAIVGGATGAAGGAAVVVAGDRNPATLPVGAVVTVRLSESLAVEVERR